LSSTSGTPRLSPCRWGTKSASAAIPTPSSRRAKFPLDYATIENVQSTPNDGHVGAFTFGKVTGIAIGIFAGLDIPLASVAPAKWKMQMRVPADKKAAKTPGLELFPQLHWRLDP
jgi:hypothetical protein